MKDAIIRRSSSAKTIAGFARNSSRGFSFLQLLIVVAIVVVLSAIALPSYITSTRGVRLKNDAKALSNLVVMGRMRASVEFSRVQLNCTLAPTSGPGVCVLQSTQFPSTSNWTNEPQKVYLSPGVSFGIPPSITTYLPSQSTGAYQGNYNQNNPTTTTNPVILFNSRGLPLDAVNGTLASDYVLYLHDASGSYYAVAVNLTGRPDLYQWNSSTKSFYGPLPE
jgi:type II secretory pathway pseudopilin PulG